MCSAKKVQVSVGSNRLDWVVWGWQKKGEPTDCRCAASLPEPSTRIVTLSHVWPRITLYNIAYAQSDTVSAIWPFSGKKPQGPRHRRCQVEEADVLTRDRARRMFRETLERMK